MRHKTFRVLFSFFSLLFLSLTAQAATLHVTNLNDTGAGSLRNTIASASTGDIIVFDVTGTIALTTGQLSVNTVLTMAGPGALQLEINGSALDRVFDFNAIGGTIQVSGMTISNGNTSGDGGCILNNASVILDEVVIENCVATGSGQGGGIYSNDDTTITNSTVQGNSSIYGGGINVNSGSLSLTNVTIANNTVGITSAGGLALGTGTATLNNVTISGNAASVDGGGLTQASGTLSIQNSIIAGNTSPIGPDCDGTIVSLDYNLMQNTSNCSFTPGLHDITGVSPDLGVLQNNGGSVSTMALAFDSPAVNAGDNSSCASTDARGVSRPQQTDCDMGAFEFAPSTLTLAASTYTVSEDGSTVTITVNRASDAGFYDGAVSVDYTTSDGTAIAGTNYTATSGTLTWDENDATAQTVNVPILNTQSASNNNFTFSLSTPTGGSSLISPDSAVVTITGTGSLVADLALEITCPADDVEVGDEITCTVTASNSGNGDSENTELELEFTNLEYDSSEAVDTSESSLLSANAVLGSCTGTSPVICGLGTLSAGETYQVNVLATVIAEGSFSMNAALSGNSGEATASGSGSGTAGGVVPIGGGGCSLSHSEKENFMQGKGMWILFGLSLFTLLFFKRKNNIIHVIVS